MMPNEYGRLLRCVQEADFSLIELNLYLDTHPENAEALSAYRTLLPRAAEAREKYESVCGPLKAENGADGSGFSWVNKPWPWEKEAN